MLLSILACSLLAACSALDIEKVQDRVFVLNDANFDEALKAHNPMVVKYYAPWCGHCKKLAGKFLTVGTMLKTNLQDDKIFMGEIDCVTEENKARCSREGISGFPVVKMKFGLGPEAKMPAQLARSDEEIYNWMLSTSTALPKEQDAAGLKKLAGSENVLIVACLDGSSSDDFTTAALSSSLPATFGWAKKEACATAFGFNKAPALVMSKDGEAPKIITEDFGSSLLVTMQAAAMPRTVVLENAGTVTLESLNAYGTSRLRVFLFNDEVSGNAVTAFEAASKAADGMGADKPLFVVTNRKALLFKYKVKKTPALFAVEDGRSYEKFNGDLTSSDEIGKYLAHVSSDDATANLSDDPAYDETERVTKIVSMDFEQRVVKGTKPVFLYVMLPTCRTCQAYAARVLQLAKALKKIDGLKDVVVAKYDASVNDFDHPALKPFENKYPNFILFHHDSYNQLVTNPFPHDMDYLKKAKYDDFLPDLVNFFFDKLGRKAPRTYTRETNQEVFGNWVIMCPHMPDTCVSENLPESAVEGDVGVDYKLHIVNWHQQPKKVDELQVMWCNMEGKEVEVARVGYEDGTMMNTKRGHKFLIFVPAGVLGPERKLVGMVDPGFNMRWRGWDKKDEATGKIVPEPYRHDVRGCESYSDKHPEEVDPDDPSEGEL